MPLLAINKIKDPSELAITGKLTANNGAKN